MPAIPFDLEQARLDIAQLRGQVTLLQEAHTQSDGGVIPNVPAAVTDLAQFATAGQQQYVSGADGNIYSNGTLRCVVPMTGTAQVVSSTTGVNVAGLVTPAAVAPGTYRIYGEVTYVCNQAGGTPTFGFTGGTIGGTNSRMRGEFAFLNTGFVTASAVFDRSGTYVGFNGPTMTNGGFFAYKFDHTLQVTTAAVMAVRALTSLGADTFTIQLGSWMYIDAIV